jgi:aryl-alcohol dehydrogenase-like predicted oxidoreductase
VLTGKYSPGDAPPSGSRATDSVGSRFMTDLLTDDVLTAVQRLKPIAAEAGLSMAQLAASGWARTS